MRDMDELSRKAQEPDNKIRRGMVQSRPEIHILYQRGSSILRNTLGCMHSHVCTANKQPDPQRFAMLPLDCGTVSSSKSGSNMWRLVLLGGVALWQLSTIGELTTYDQVTPHTHTPRHH